MSWRKYLIIYFHELFGMHHFELVSTGVGSYLAKCRCGCLLKRAPK